MTILDRIKTHSRRLTDADQKLITTMLENRAEAAFLSGPQLSQRASVHEATATRLAQKLGYKGFPDLRAQRSARCWTTRTRPTACAARSRRSSMATT